MVTGYCFCPCFPVYKVPAIFLIGLHKYFLSLSSFPMLILTYMICTKFAWTLAFFSDIITHCYSPLQNEKNRYVFKKMKNLLFVFIATIAKNFGFGVILFFFLPSSCSLRGTVPYSLFCFTTFHAQNLLLFSLMQTYLMKMPNHSCMV